MKARLSYGEEYFFITILPGDHPRVSHAWDYRHEADDKMYNSGNYFASEADAWYALAKAKELWQNL